MNISVVKTLEGFQSLKNDWEHILQHNGENHFYLSFDWFYSLLSFYRHAPRDLYILCFRENSTMAAILPLCISRKRLRLFSCVSLEIIGSIYYSPLRGFIVKRGFEQRVAENCADFLLNKCATAWELIQFEGLSPGDPFWGPFKHYLAEQNISTRTADQYVNYFIDTAAHENSHDYWMQRRQSKRRNIKKSISKMTAAGTFDIILTMHQDQDLDTAMKHYYDIYSHSWKVPEKDPQLHLKLAHYLRDKNKLRLFILYFKPSSTDVSEHPLPTYEGSLRQHKTIPEGYVPIAAMYSIVHKQKAFALKTAYRDDYAEFSSGTALMWFSLKYLIDVDKVTEIDFGEGNEPYKSRWARIRETHQEFQAAHPQCRRGRFELWNERRIIAPLRALRNRQRQAGKTES